MSDDDEPASAVGPHLVVVGTPIGNLADWSARAQRALVDAEVIVCEDTRRTGSLLAKHGIANPGLIVANEHTERSAAAQTVDALSAGRRVALVTDAGMPAISDPGAIIVAAAVQAGHRVVVVPGPTAVSAALSLSGFTAGRFVFEGFLPRKGRMRADRLSELAGESRMIVLYEAPHRIVRTLGDLVEWLGPDRTICVARELTKLHEQVWHGSLGDAVDALGEPRGEYVIVVDAAAPPAEPDDELLTDALVTEREAGASTRDAVAAVVARFGVGRNRVYRLANDLDAG